MVSTIILTQGVDILLVVRRRLHHGLHVEAVLHLAHGLHQDPAPVSPHLLPHLLQGPAGGRAGPGAVPLAAGVGLAHIPDLRLEFQGVHAKMKDAAKRWYQVDGQDTDPILSQIVDHNAKCWVGSHKENGKTVDDYETKDGVNAMKTVKWDWEIEGFNGFMYCMDSQIVNNAKYPYTACLFARILLEQSSYTKAIYNSANPDANGNAANQYGYYYPGTASADFKYAKDDWSKEKHIQNEINEDYGYLKSVKSSLVQSILVKVAANNN